MGAVCAGEEARPSPLRQQHDAAQSCATPVPNKRITSPFISVWMVNNLLLLKSGVSPHICVFERQQAQMVAALADTEALGSCCQMPWNEPTLPHLPLFCRQASVSGITVSFHLLKTIQEVLRMHLFRFQS